MTSELSTFLTVHTKQDNRTYLLIVPVLSLRMHEVFRKGLQVFFSIIPVLYRYLQKIPLSVPPFNYTVQAREEIVQYKYIELLI